MKCGGSYRRNMSPPFSDMKGNPKNLHEKGIRLSFPP
jgi:hypothetical protein